jgi:hypothetical protein
MMHLQVEVRVVKIIPDIIICRPCQTNVTSMSHRHGQTTHWRRPMHIAQPRAPYSTPFQQPLPSLNLPPRSLLTAIIFISSCFVRNSTAFDTREGSPLRSISRVLHRRKQVIHHSRATPALILYVDLAWNSLVRILSVTKSESISQLPSQITTRGNSLRIALSTITATTS